jgi:GTP diphosphokinase / guanosine-3',5'-bis(diphosphate) 3'-diphosphatase
MEHAAEGLNEVTLLARAWRVAAEQHVDQRRKGNRAEPYINHLAEVAELVAEATGGSDARLVAAAVLHDTIEDSDMTRAKLERLFGTDVAQLVAEVSDDTSLPRQERKRLQVAHAPRKSARAKILKLADKTSNLRSVTHSPPSEWSLDRRRNYLTWARDVAVGLRGVNSWLEGEFDRAAAELERMLERQESKP